MSGMIEKGVEAPKSFEDGMRAAEEEAGIPSDAELYGEAWANPEPDETGRIPSASPPRDEEGNAITPAEEAEAPEAETTPAEPEPAAEPPATDPVLLAELQELKSKVGTLVNENAELRRAQAQPVDGNWFEDLMDSSPGEAAYVALQNGRSDLYERAIRQWYDVDPVAAQRYERRLEMEQYEQKFTEQLRPQIEGANDLVQRQEMEQAMRAVKDKHDDFDTVVGSLDQGAVDRLVQDGFPVEVLAGLAGDQKAKASTLELLYRWVKDDHAATIRSEAPKIEAEAQEEAKARKRAATVASASTTTPDPVEESEGERLMRVWREQRPTLRDGWQNRGSGR